MNDHAFLVLRLLSVGGAAIGLVCLLFLGAVSAVQTVFGRRRIKPKFLGEGASDWTLATYDDGTRIFLSCHAGGAAPEGAWGTLSLMRTEADGSATFRRFTADGPWAPSEISHAWVDEAGAITPEMARAVVQRRDGPRRHQSNLRPADRWPQ